MGPYCCVLLQCAQNGGFTVLDIQAPRKPLEFTRPKPFGSNFRVVSWAGYVGLNATPRKKKEEKKFGKAIGRQTVLEREQIFFPPDQQTNDP